MPTNTAKTVTKAAVKSAAKPAPATAAKTVIKTISKPALKAVAKPAAKPVAKAVVKLAVKPAVKPVSKIAKPAEKSLAKPAAKPTTKITATKSVAVKKSAFMKPLQPSKQLAFLLGSSDPFSRTEVTKLLWDYIKKNKLQNPANKRNILCNLPLEAVMGKKEVTMFEMAGLVGKHLTNV